MGSCVSKKKVAELQANYDNLKTEHADLQTKFNENRLSLAECNANSKSLADRLADEQRRNQEMRESYSKLQSSYQDNVQAGNVNISKLVDEINASNKFIKQLVDAKSKSDSLNQADEQIDPFADARGNERRGRTGIEGRRIHLIG